MSKGKGSRVKYTSKGERVSMNTAPLKALKRERSGLDNAINKMDAFLAGKKVYFTIPNPNPNETAKKLIRVLGSTLYGDFRKFGKGIRMNHEKE